MIAYCLLPIAYCWLAHAGFFTQRRRDAKKYICSRKDNERLAHADFSRRGAETQRNTFACAKRLTHAKIFTQRRGVAEKYICLRKDNERLAHAGLFTQRRGDAEKYICLRKDGVAPLPPSGGRGRACLLKRQGWGLFTQRRRDAEQVGHGGFSRRDAETQSRWGLFNLHFSI